MIWVASKMGMRMFITVEDGKVRDASSPDAACFDPSFLGEPWPQVKSTLEDGGFLVHQGD